MFQGAHCSRSLGMERVHASTLAAWKRAAGPGIRLFNAYGPAEATCGNPRSVDSFIVEAKRRRASTMRP